MYYGYYPPYVSVAEKKAKAEQRIAALRKKGIQCNPIADFRGNMAKTFWGKSWCENLEKYRDYEYRLERGRSYVRHGCVCHLDITQGNVFAYVSGSSLYTVEIKIDTLDAAHWQKVCEQCAGSIGSLVDLLKGKLSQEVMRVVCDQESGIFPNPKEIHFHCSCPDVANLCKHVAAVLYGIGRRFDEDSALLFTLRGVDPTDLLHQNLTAVSPEEEQTLNMENMAELFDIDLDTTQEASPTTSSKASPPKPQKVQKKVLFDPSCPTAEDIRRVRELSGLSLREFADQVKVTQATVRRWCGANGMLNINAVSVRALTAMAEKLANN